MNIMIIMMNANTVGNYCCCDWAVCGPHMLWCYALSDVLYSATYVVLRGDMPSVGPSGAGAWPLPLIHNLPHYALLNLTTLNYCATQHTVRYQRPF